MTNGSTMSQGPMIEVHHLTKRYGSHPAVDDVSFTVQAGEIVGLLGRNGAGKSTTMRVLACYMPATSGSARVAGHEVFWNANEVRRRIGYMPANNPLYLDMRVRSYLEFRARLKGVNSTEVSEQVDMVLLQCGLAEVSDRVIQTLPRACRQRVGLADTLVHNPELVILDEPTNGLAPDQAPVVRQMIKDLSPRHTVLVSAHSFSEAEAICQRVLILHEGRILAAESIA
jgi:ABC-2 type transport system ATP-binding protein